MKMSVNNMMMMMSATGASDAARNAVVIGATGYVGSAITKGLVQHPQIKSIKCTTRNVQEAKWLTEFGSDVEIVSLQLQDNNANDDNNNNNNNGTSCRQELKKIMKGCDMVFFCAGYEDQAPSTIDFMVNNAVIVIEVAKEEHVKVVVLTSSGGSTNPVGLLDSTPKSELLHFSNPVEQIKRGRYSPAAKTLMEIKSFEAVGRNHQNDIIDQELASQESTPRLIIMNPNLILGPPLDPSKQIKGNSLPWMIQILKGETMSDYIPNDSMSIIDIRDLAQLHIAAAFDSKANGRYFGVNQSFTWKEILNEFHTILQQVKNDDDVRIVEGDSCNRSSSSDHKRHPYEFKLPPLQPNEDYENKIPTQFDHTRMNSLGVPLRSLHDTLKDLIDFFITKGAI